MLNAIADHKSQPDVARAQPDWQYFKLWRPVNCFNNIAYLFDFLTRPPYSFPVLCGLFCQEVENKTNQTFAQTYNCIHTVIVITNCFVSEGLVLDIL